MGETRRAYSTHDAEAGGQDSAIGFEPFGKKDAGALDGRAPGGSEAGLQNGTEAGAGTAAVRDKEAHPQREAVIRPQQAGKIDFKSLQSRPKFPSDGHWGAVKGSPQSPPGKSRAREKNRRSGKGDRGHQQLYRLTISGARPHPTIGIAYPQQKVAPPKKPDLGHGPVSGSYRFHVPSAPERAVELQQEDFGFPRCFPEAAPGLPSGNYTSPAAAAHPSPGGKAQPAAGTPQEGAAPHGPLHYLAFQGKEKAAWPPPEKSLPGADSGLPAPRPFPFPEGGKASAHGGGPLSFPYPLPTLHSTATEPFHGEAHAPEYVDVGLASGQISHGAFAFHSSARDWKGDVLSGGSSYGHVATEGRTYALAPAPPAPFLPSPAPGLFPGYKGRRDPSPDHNGAISPSGAIDPSPGAFPEGLAVFPPSLHISSMPKLIGKRLPLPKDAVAGQRALDPGGSLRRVGPQTPLPPPHCQSKAYGDPSASSSGPRPSEKSLAAPVQGHPRLPQPWEGSKRTFSPLEHSPVAYPSPGGGQSSFGGPPEPEQRHPAKKPWQQLPFASASPGQNRIELSRKLAAQKLPFPLGAPEWDASAKGPQSSGGYTGKAPPSGEGPARSSPGSGSTANPFSFDAATDTEPLAACGPRNKPLFFGVSPPVLLATTRLPCHPPLGLPPPAMAASPSNSPLPSPAPHPTGGSSCSSLSPTSGSPESFEGGVALAASPFFHPPCPPKDSSKPLHPPEAPGSGMIHYPPTEAVKAFHFSQDVAKEDLLYRGLPGEGHAPRLAGQSAKGGLEGCEADLPPPPYSSHHLLATSLSSASLDQLDVLLTCKQCDQNFGNLSSFLEHRQFCSSHAMLQGPAREPPRGTEGRRPPPAPPESVPPAHGSPGPPLPPDPHPHLLALNRAADALADGESKGEAREEALRGGQLGLGPATGSLPLSTSDLEIDDAKLDHLITEALNGLGYQSDTPEIDSSFIDVFADEELASVKVGSGSGTLCKARESATSGKKAKHPGVDENGRTLGCHGDHPGGEPARSKPAAKQHGHKERGLGWLLDHGEERLELQHKAEVAPNRAMDPATYDGAQASPGTPLKVRRRNGGSSLPPKGRGASSISEAKVSKNIAHASPPSGGLPSAGPSVAARDPKPTAKGGKERKLRSGSWSKELIHKIVQQKNKLHQLHPKSRKAGPPLSSFLADRRLPEGKDSKLRAYEYISESDEERVEHTKQHCRRKLGSRLNGRRRSSFGRRCRGREKEPEPDWRYGPRRDWEGPKGASGRDPHRRGDGSGRVRRRSNRSSSSSFQSTVLSSEASSSPRSTERADSDTEKESEQRRRLPQSARGSRPLLGESPNASEEETTGRSQRGPPGLPREPGGGGSPHTQPAACKACPRAAPEALPVLQLPEEAGLLHTPGQPQPSKGAPGKGLPTPFSAGGPEHSSRRSAQEHDKPKAPEEALGLGTDQRCHLITTYKGDAVKYPAEEFLSPASRGHHAAEECGSYEEADLKCLRKQKAFPAPVSCFQEGPPGIGVAVGGPHALVDATETLYDCKGLPSSYDTSSLFSGPPGTEAAPADNVYLCPGDADLGPFKPKHHKVAPYGATTVHSQVSSPLQFDSSAVFGELPATDFDASLYDSVASGKDTYVPFECVGHQLGKMVPFDQHYSSFLQEKDWALMEDDLAPFHSLSVEKPGAKRFPGEMEQMTLPEQMADYGMAFMSSISDDELEIKRLVSELESQLQTSKLSLEDAPVEHQAPTERKEAAHPFLSLTLGQEGEGKGLFLMEAEFEEAAVSCSCDNMGNEKALLSALEGKYGSQRDPWPCPVPLRPLQPTVCSPSAPDLMLTGPFSCKADQDKLKGNLKDAGITGEGGFREIQASSTAVQHTACLPDQPEAPDYAKHLMPSPSPLLAKALGAPKLNAHDALPPSVDAFPELPPKEETLAGAAELEAYEGQVPRLQLESAVQDIGTPASDGHLPSDAQGGKGPEERLFQKTGSPAMLGGSPALQGGPGGPLLLEEAEGAEGHPAHQSPALRSKDTSGKPLHFDVLTFSKELEEEEEYESAPRGETAHPLQQLQLFVARTVKSNEEDLLLPCFPGRPPHGHLPAPAESQPEQAEEAAGGRDGAGSPTLEEAKEALAEASEHMADVSDPIRLFLESGKQLEFLGGPLCCGTKPAVLGSPRQQPRFEDGCPGVRDIHVCADGLSLQHGRLLPLASSAGASLPREEGVRGGGQVTRELEGKPEEAPVAFRDCRKSPLSPGPFAREASRCALPAVLKAHAACHTTWAGGCQDGRAAGTGKAHRREASGEQVPALQRDLSPAPTTPPEKPPEDDSPLPGSRFGSGDGPVSAVDGGLWTRGAQHVSAPPGGFSLDTGFADQNAPFGVPPSEEAPGGHMPLPPRRRSPGPEKPPPGSPLQSPLGPAEQPFSPVLQHCGTSSPLPVALLSVAHRPVDSSGKAPPPAASSLHSAHAASALVQAERPLLLHTDCRPSAHELPLLKKARAEEPPSQLGHEDGERCSAPGKPASSQPPALQDALPGQPPSGTDSALLRDARTQTHAELMPKPQEGRAVGSCPQKGGKEEPQPGAASKGIAAREMPAASSPERADGGTGGAGPGPEAEPQKVRWEAGCSGNFLEEADLEGKEREGGTSGFPVQEESEDGRPRDPSEPMQAKAKRRKGLPATCEICSVSFRSKTGLMRHKAVKHQSQKDGTTLLGSGFAPLEKAFKTRQQLSGRNRRASTNAHVAKAAEGRPSPKSYRSQRKEPSREIQEVVCRVLGDLSAIPLDTTHDIQSTSGPRKESRIESMSSQAQSSDELASASREDPRAKGEDRQLGTDAPDKFAGKKMKGRARKTRATSRGNEIIGASHLGPGTPPVCSNMVSCTVDVILMTTTEALESSSTPSTEQTSLWSPSPPHPLAVRGVGDGGERPSSAGPKLLRDEESCQEEVQDPEAEAKQLPQERWPSSCPEEPKETSSDACEGQDKERSREEPESKGSPFEGANCRNPNNSLVYLPSPKAVEQSSHVGAAQPHLSDVAAEEAAGRAGPSSGDSKLWRMEGLQPRKESHGEGAAGPKLHSLFDDDSKFSQLFPRNDHFARRKCTRVYGKRTKKPRPLAEASARTEGMADLFTIRMASDLGETSSFCVTREDPREEDADGRKGSAFGFFCQRSPAGALPGLSSWGREGKKEDFPVEGALLRPCMETPARPSAGEASPGPPNLEEESCGPGAREPPHSPAFHTIDMETLNTKFELAGGGFYGAGEDPLRRAEEDCALGFEPTLLPQGRPTPSKPDEGKPGKPRSEPPLKEKQYKCRVCFQWFLTLGELDFHKLTHNPSPPPTCYMCVQRRFSSREQLRDHLKEKHARNKAGLWACGMCLKETSEVWMYNEHLREHATQFARRGRAQKTALGLPGCLAEQDAAVTHFLNSLMCRKPSRPAEGGSRAPLGRAGRAPREPAGREAAPGEDAAEAPGRTRPPGTAPKAPAAPSPDPAPKVEGPPKPVPMHPECKDPSRDCHHCGKQFPKPFKLQRHLVVHSLQKIYLCHRCPEADVKHTTLYTCELCADVMHVIKKSFICSACNYTFSKKEQYDRHMEKHLGGSSTTLRFRGVMRPGGSARGPERKIKEEARPREEAPLSKRKKAAPHGSAPAPGPPPQRDCPGAALPDGEALCVAVGGPVKVEDAAGGPPSRPAGAQGSPLDAPPPALPPEPKHESTAPEPGHLVAPSAGLPTKGGSPGEKPPPPADSSSGLVGAERGSMAQNDPGAAPAALPPVPLPEKHKEPDVPEEATSRSRGTHGKDLCRDEEPATEKPELPGSALEPPEGRRPPRTPWGSGPPPREAVPRETSAKLPPLEAPFHVLPLKDKTASPALNRPAKETPSKRVSGGRANAETAPSVGEAQEPPSRKDKAPPDTEAAPPKDQGMGTSVVEAGGTPTRPLSGQPRGEAAGAPAKHSHPDPSRGQERPAVNGLARPHPKKRKEHKSCHKGSPASRENIEGDGGKKKKARTQDAAKGDGVGAFRRADWPDGEALALSPRKSDPHLNKLAPKLKMSVAGGQLKKMVLDQCFQKKVEIRHANGELRRRKDILGSKAFHQLLAKEPSTSLPCSVSRHRAVQGAKLPDTHNYRTAESQNNLLSQLFGQKLTSFKIPLRRDTSE
uniref:Zinc finger protein 469 n=1 Tax=Varanus komodoensis TaxID=61221 RepID=A0A8D2LF26_VARKO